MEKTPSTEQKRIDRTEESTNYAEMQDGEIVPVYDYHYTGTVDIWTDDGIKRRPATEISQDEVSTLNTFYSGIEA